MISSEFKELVKAVKKLGKGYDTPYNILFDKVTGELKQTPKNLQAFELVKLYDKIDDAEKKALQMGWRDDSPLKHALDAYLKAEVGQDTSIFTFSLPDLSSDYRRKMKTIQLKKEKDAKKAAVSSAKATAAASLNRKDVADVIKRISSQMAPYIKEGEDKIKDGVVKIAERVRADYKKDAIDWAKKEHGMVGVPKRIYDYVKLRDGNQVPFSGLFNLSPFMDKYHDPKNSFRTRVLKPNIQIFIDGREKELYERAMKMFRDGEEFKVSVLFHRLFKSNPTLVGYEMLEAYDGDEFTIGAKNEKGEKIVIQTNTITAGGYNIQRLHTRWLVSVRNSATGKTEKFTIDDKAKA
jgi:hypothetical protein